MYAFIVEKMSIMEYYGRNGPAAVEAVIRGEEEYRRAKETKLSEIVQLMRGMDLDALITEARSRSKFFLSEHEKSLFAKLNEVNAKRVIFDSLSPIERDTLYSNFEWVQRYMTSPSYPKVSGNNKYDDLRAAFRGVFEKLGPVVGGRRRSTRRSKSASRKTRRHRRN
jgi:hypothetical protein